MKTNISHNISRAALTLLMMLAMSLTASATTITLNSNTGEVTLQNGDVLTGTGGANTHVYIADGATVTLNGVNITAITNDNNHQWAGISCLGNAIIVLNGGTTNSLKGGFHSPGIHVPVNKTLTLQGSGTLNTTGNDYAAGIGSGYQSSCGNITISGGNITATGGQYAAGIGSGHDHSYCGNITINAGTVIAIGHSGTTAENEGAVGIGSGSYYSNCEGITISGGTVTATGSQYGAGIGSGSYESDCGYITISGGTVTATGGEKGAGIGDSSNNSFCVDMTISGGTVTAIGGWGAAGIGSGYSYTECWSITISGGTVTATGGQYAPGIGSGYYNSSCGEVTITNGVTLVTATKGGSCNNAIGAGNFQSTCGPVTIGDLGTGFIKQSPFVTFPYTVRFNPNSGTGTMDDQGFMYNVAQKLTANSFTLLGSEFEGWATTANGEKEYDNNEKVTNLADTIAIVTLYAKWIPDLSMNGDVYTIYTATGWDLFCNLLADNNYNNFAGKTVNLANDITVTTMAGVWNGGSDNQAFRGTFDGQGHTLTLNYSSTEDQCAPFRYINNATFQNLRVAGTINTSGQYGGVVGRAYGTNSFTNCRSSITINSTKDGDGTHGGFVGLISQGTTTFTGCAFDGTFTSTVTTNWGGFVGFVEGNAAAHATFRNCLFAPANSAFEFNTDGSQTFARLRDNNSSYATFSSTYVNNYTKALGGTQGKHVYSITGDQFVTVAFSGSATTHYNVSDIHVYSYGKVYNNTPYASKETTVSLNLGCTPPSGSTCVGYQASAGTLTGSANPYTLAMPAANVTIQPIWSIALEGTGTSTDPYLISSVADWDLFAQVVTEGITLANQYVQLNADITVTAMAGSWTSDSDYHAFSGTFNGQGHTLTLNYSSNETHCAPFRVIDGATIQNLHLAGTINAGDQFSAMVGHAYGDCNFTNCRSSITINSSRSGYGTHGGFVGRVRTGTSNFVGCVFDGFFSGPNTHAWGGFVGHVESTSLANFTDCLFAPVNSSFDFDIYDSQTFARLRNDNPIYATFTNCYYTQILGGAQGKQAHSITPDENVTVAFSGQATDYTMSGISAYGAGMVYDSILYAGNGDTVSLSLSCTPPSGFACIGYEASAGTLTGTANPYTLTMPAEDVTILPILSIPLEGTGTSDDPYLITSVESWNTFAYNVTNGTSYSGQYVQLAADITVTTMAGDSGHAFSGTFDGQGHTLTVNYNTTQEVTAPFRYVNGATIANLVTAGTISTSRKYAGGVIGRSLGGAVSITNCVSGVTINSSVNGDGTHGGFVGVIQYSTLTITGSMFSGEMLGASTTLCGGFVGWTQSSNSTTTITNCLFAPTNLEISSGHTFSRASDLSGVTITNSYYTVPLDVLQGKQALSITGIKSANVAFRGGHTSYNVSGIDAYSVGMKYAGTCYAGNGETVSLDLTHDNHPGYTYGDGYIASAGTLNGTGNPYTLTMPNQNVTIAPNITAATVSVVCTPNIYGAAQVSLDNTNWSSSVTAAVGATVYTRINEPLGYQFYYFSLEAENGEPFNSSGNHFTMPAANVTYSVGFSPNPYYFDNRTVTLSPGEGTGDPIVYPFDPATAAPNAASADTCQFYYVNDHTLGFRLPENYCPNSFTAPYGGAFLGWDGGSNDGYITLTSMATTFTAQWLDRIVTLSPGLGGGESIVYTFNPETAAPNAASADTCQFYYVNYNTIGFRLGDDCPNSFTAPDGLGFSGWNNSGYVTLTSQEITFTAQWGNPGPPVNYIDENGEIHTLHYYTVLTGGVGETTLAAGWYVVDNDITYSNDNGNALTLNGDVTLILCNGKTMTVAPTSGIGIDGFQKTLTIYGQSLNSNVAGTLNVIGDGSNKAIELFAGTYTQHSGNVLVNNSNADALSANNITINGGSINANGGVKGIDASNLSINGGSINANGGERGIDASNLTINGGSINANGGNTGIWAWNVMTINGGKVEASSIWVWNNITLGWTHADDYILAGEYSYYYNNGSTVSVKSGQTFYYENNGVNVTVSGTLNSDQINAIGGKTLRPYIEPITVTKQIAGYGTGNGGWHLIASPVYGTLDPATVGNMIANTATYYDLFRFNPSHEGNEWENYKADSTFMLEAGKGYLYANKNNVTLTFSGPSYFGNSCEIALVYDSTDYQKCWNLVGNPFDTAATLNKDCYTLSTDGTGINSEAIPAGTPIPPCTAVFVKAVAVGDKAVFTKVTQ